MENGHVATTNNVKGNTNIDAKSTSDTDSMEDTVEFRLMMAYAQRRRPRGDLPSHESPAGTENEVTKVKKAGGKKKKKKKSILRGLFKCVKPQGEEEEEAREQSEEIATGGFRSLDGAGKNRELEEVAGRLTKISDEVQLTPSDIEADGEEDNVEKLIGLLLRESGDKFNQEVLKDASLARELVGDYSFFDRLMSTFFRKMGFSTFNPEALGPQGSPKTQIALTCEVTTRLSAVDTLPMSRLLGFGAKYLQDHYSAWAEQQGGYGEAVDDDEEEVQ